MKTKALALLLALVVLLLCGCGAQSTSTEAMDMAYNAAEAPEAKESGSLSMDGSAQSASLPEGRKWIVTVSMTAETEDLNALLGDLNSRITALGGYIEDQSIHNGSIYATRRYRYANLTIRIPAEDVAAFTDEVKAISNIISSEESRDDVTLSYVATESRLKALQAEEERLLELMAQAENMSDLLEIEERLTDVRYELENVTSQLRTYDNKIDYATIYLDIEEVQKLTPVAEKTTWERISEGFVSSLESLRDGVVELSVWLAVNSPYLVLWAVALAAVFFVIKRRVVRRRAMRAAAQPLEEKAT